MAAMEALCEFLLAARYSGGRTSRILSAFHPSELLKLLFPLELAFVRLRAVLLSLVVLALLWLLLLLFDASDLLALALPLAPVFFLDRASSRPLPFRFGDFVFLEEEEFEALDRLLFSSCAIFLSVAGAGAATGAATGAELGMEHSGQRGSWVGLSMTTRLVSVNFCFQRRSPCWWRRCSMLDVRCSMLEAAAGSLSGRVPR